MVLLPDDFQLLVLWGKHSGRQRVPLKATYHSTIFDIPMHPVREDQRH